MLPDLHHNVSLDVKIVLRYNDSIIYEIDGWAERQALD